MAGRVYMPPGTAARGIGIVFCHGFGGTKEGTPPGLSGRLAAHGYTVLTFDYRGFGGSEGPRGRLVPAEQVEDAVHAVEYLCKRPGIDSEHVGIYGTSFGGGVALMAGRRSGRVRTAVVTVPVTSGSHWLQSLMRWYEFQQMHRRALQAIGDKAATGEMPVVERFEIMVPDELTRARYTDPVPLALETFYHVLHHEPLAEATEVRFPVAVLGIEGDQLVPVEQAVQLYNRLGGPKVLHLFDRGTHFSVYDELLDPVAAQALAWFDQHLDTTPRSPQAVQEGATR
jgi:alpha-beta hydrolase superfamily lysophospholipase